MVSEKALADFEQRIVLSRMHAEDIDKSSGRRTSVPVRLVFVRDRSEQGVTTPLAKLVGTGGRGADVALKLYLGLIWRSSGEPFTTVLPTRRWAELLALPEPETNGARRIADAIKALRDDHRLIAVDHHPGEPSEITLLHESGTDQPYARPRGNTAPDLYFHIPAAMWTSGQLQRLTAPGLAMLLAVLSEQTRPGDPVWWSTTRFINRIGLSPATRARGTRELKDAGLLTVKKQAITVSPGRTFVAERVRSLYSVTGAAKFSIPTKKATTSKARQTKRTQMAKANSNPA